MHKPKRMSTVEGKRRAALMEALTAAGLDLLVGQLAEDWDAKDLHLYPIRGAVGADLKVTIEKSRQAIASKPWGIDVGLRSRLLPGPQGERLRRELVARSVLYIPMSCAPSCSGRRQARKQQDA